MHPYMHAQCRHYCTGRSQTACRSSRRIQYKNLHIWDLPEQVGVLQHTYNIVSTIIIHLEREDKIFLICCNPTYNALVHAGEGKKKNVLLLRRHY